MCGRGGVIVVLATTTVFLLAGEAFTRTLEESAAQYEARQAKPELAEVDVKTGEEEESNVFQVRVGHGSYIRWIGSLCTAVFCVGYDNIVKCHLITGQLIHNIWKYPNDI